MECDSGRIRTFNLLLRRQLLYPVELRNQNIAVLQCCTRSAKMPSKQLVLARIPEGSKLIRRDPGIGYLAYLLVAGKLEQLYTERTNIQISSKKAPLHQYLWVVQTHFTGQCPLLAARWSSRCGKQPALLKTIPPADLTAWEESASSQP